ncbi:hypothetical protein ACWEWX_46670, partial [Streptomyces asiaticus]
MTRLDWQELDWQRAAPADLPEGAAYLEVAVGPDDQILMNRPPMRHVVLDRRHPGYRPGDRTA